MWMMRIALVFLVACRGDATLSAKLTTATPAATTSVRVPQAAPKPPRLPPPPLDRRAHVMITAPAVPCDGVKVRLYANGERRSCIVAAAMKPDEDGHVVVSCGTRAELPSEVPVTLELRYERHGVEVARVDLGTETLEAGDQTLEGRALAYRDRSCAKSV